MGRLDAVITSSSEHIARSRLAIDRSNARMRVSAALILASQRWRVPELRGSAADDDGREALRTRCRDLLLTMSGTPTVFAGPSLATRPCEVCGHAIPYGSTEYELAFASRMIRVDRRCFAMWQSEQTPR